MMQRIKTFFLRFWHKGNNSNDIIVFVFFIIPMIFVFIYYIDYKRKLLKEPIPICVYEVYQGGKKIDTVRIEGDWYVRKHLNIKKVECSISVFSSQKTNDSDDSIYYKLIDTKIEYLK